MSVSRLHVYKSSHIFISEGEQATYLIHADGLSIQPHLVHDARGIFSILLADKFHKAITLVTLCNSVLGQVNVHDAASLQHELPYQAVRYPLIDVADVDGGFLILLPVCFVRLWDTILED